MATGPRRGSKKTTPLSNKETVKKATAAVVPSPRQRRAPVRTFDELDVRVELLGMQADGVPALQRVFAAANEIDLRTVTDPADRERLKRIRRLARELLVQLKGIR